MSTYLLLKKSGRHRGDYWYMFPSRRSKYRTSVLTVWIRFLFNIPPSGRSSSSNNWAAHHRSHYEVPFTIGFLPSRWHPVGSIMSASFYVAVTLHIPVAPNKYWSTANIKECILFTFKVSVEHIKAVYNWYDYSKWIPYTFISLERPWSKNYNTEELQTK